VHVLNVSKYSRKSRSDSSCRLFIIASQTEGHSRDTQRSPLLVRRTARAHCESDNLFQKTIHFTKFSGQTEHLHALFVLGPGLVAVFHLNKQILY